MIVRARLLIIVDDDLWNRDSYICVLMVQEIVHQRERLRGIGSFVELYKV